jgi:hypothetical protein
MPTAWRVLITWRSPALWQALLGCLESYSVLGLLAIIGRFKEAAAALAAKGYQLQTLLTIRDFGIEPVAG